MHLGAPELLLICVIALLLFGPKKLGDLGKGLGEGIRNFKSGLNGSPEHEAKPATPAPPTAAPPSPTAEPMPMIVAEKPDPSAESKPAGDDKK